MSNETDEVCVWALGIVDGKLVDKTSCGHRVPAIRKSFCPYCGRKIAL